jgi:hypothetical protein
VCVLCVFVSTWYFFVNETKRHGNEMVAVHCGLSSFGNDTPNKSRVADARATFWSSPDGSFEYLILSPPRPDNKHFDYIIMIQHE